MSTFIYTNKFNQYIKTQFHYPLFPQFTQVRPGGLNIFSPWDSHHYFDFRFRHEPSSSATTIDLYPYCSVSDSAGWKNPHRILSDYLEKLAYSSCGERKTTGRRNRTEENRNWDKVSWVLFEWLRWNLPLGLGLFRLPRAGRQTGCCWTCPRCVWPSWVHFHVAPENEKKNKNFSFNGTGNFRN